MWNDVHTLTAYVNEYWHCQPASAEAATRRQAEARDSERRLVAGVGFEPTTNGL